MGAFFGVVGGGFLGYGLAGWVFAGELKAWRRMVATAVLTLVVLVAGVAAVLSKGFGFYEMVFVGVLVAAVAEVFKRRAVRVGVVDGGAFTALFGVALVVLFGGFGPVESKKQAAVVSLANETPAPQVAQVQSVTEKAAAVESCDCDSGAVCTGPKGGEYCLTKSGNKKYL